MKKVVPIIALLGFMTMIIVKPEYYIASATRGLSLFAAAVLPALFPFFFCTSLLTAIGAGETVSKVFQKPVNKLFGAPPVGAYAMICAFLCGYPVGSAVISDLYKNSIIDTDGAKRILPFSSTSGVVFMVGTAGAVLFGNPTIGAIIAVSHYIVAILNGILFGTVFRIKDRKNNNGTKQAALGFLPSPKTDADNVLSAAISSSTIAMLSVGGYIVLANMLIDTVQLISITSTLPNEFLTFLYGAIEMTRGCMYASKIEYMPLAVCAAEAVIAFGGVSVSLQSMTFLSKCGVKYRYFLAVKLSQAAISSLVALLFSLIFSQFILA